MERKVGEIFEIDGVFYRVAVETCICNGCDLKGYLCQKTKNIRGECQAANRKEDGVIFVKIEYMETRNIKLSLEKAKEFYTKGGEFKDLALSAFTEEELTKKEFPKTWEEYVLRSQGILDDTHNSWIKLQAGEADIAFCKLHYLRDDYRQGWKPNFNDKNVKYCIKVKEDYVYIYTSMETSHFLSFQTIELASEFVYNFKDLIIQAGDLI